MAIIVESYAVGRWHPPGADGEEVASAVDGQVVAVTSSYGLGFADMVTYARHVGGPALRALDFHRRADLVKRVAVHLTERKEALYALSYNTGATRKDSWIDIDGGIGTLFSYASAAKRELPSETFITENVEALSRGGSFVGTHILSSLHGVAVHINAYNFPCWGMLEKLAPALIAGVPVITKPATVTGYVAHAVVQMIVESRILPPGALQFIGGGAGDLLDHLTGQDVVSFTGSIRTSELLRNNPVVSSKAVRFIAERDSLNAAILGPDAGPGTPEFELFVKEVVREMTVKAGQKCTAIRRVIVPRALVEPAGAAIAARLGRVVMGDPRRDDVTMGPLAGTGQRSDVRHQIAQLLRESEIVSGDPGGCAALGVADGAGAFLSPILLHNGRPHASDLVHQTEAFGPVASIMPYEDVADAIALAQRGEGSLVASAYTHDDAVARTLVAGLAPYHGRLLLLDRDCAKESTGHGSPLPSLVHGGPGRAGGGEELGGIRGVKHYMQRTALQGSPSRLASLTKRWIRGASETVTAEHPFRRDFATLEVGDTVNTGSRMISLADIEHFAEFSGDRFYAHMDEAAAAANPFFPGRVAHGYLLLSFAAGLFVDPAPGPLLANYGLEGLRFLKPVVPGDSIRVRLTVKSKNAAREPSYGEVRWDVEIFNQNDETVARYELLTMSARPAGDAS